MEKLYYYNFNSERLTTELLQYISYLRICEAERYRRRNISKLI
jgi:hypothetical protein